MTSPVNTSIINVQIMINSIDLRFMLLPDYLIFSSGTVATSMAKMMYVES